METKRKRIGWATLPYLPDWRAKYVLSQEELARRAQVSRATISSAEQGRRISFKAAESIARAFGVDRVTLAQAPTQERQEASVGHV
jgi:transcriptional regulator with XRE-family HTH domain